MFRVLAIIASLVICSGCAIPKWTKNECPGVTWRGETTWKPCKWVEGASDVYFPPVR